MTEITTGYCCVVEIPFAIHLYDSKFQNFKKIDKNQKEIFVILNEMNFWENLSKSTPHTAYSASIIAAAMRFGTYVNVTKNGLNKKAEEYGDFLIKEFRETKKIAGFEVYCVNQNLKVWIGKNDFKHLLEVHTWKKK